MTRFSLTFCLLLCALPTFAAPRYKITPLPGMNIWDGNASLNSSGMVTCGDKVWQNGKTWTIQNPTGDPHYRQTDASGINDAGTVIGTFHGVEDGAWLVAYARVFVWNAGRVTLLPETDNSGLSAPYAKGINNAGDILVHVQTQSPNPDEEFGEDFIYHTGHYNSLPASNALLVSSSGEFIPVNMPKSVVPLCGTPGNVSGATATGIVVGQYQSKKGLRACVWRKGRCYDVCGTTGFDSNPFGLNNRGQVVGQFFTGKDDKNGNNIFRAFLWQDGRMTDLNTLISKHSGWVLTEADAINDRGQIVCAGNKGACLLTPINGKRRRR